MNSKAIKRQLLAAIAMVLVAALALGSSTYAWFVASGTVTATGMKVQATSEGGLAISHGGAAWGTSANGNAGTTASELNPASTKDFTKWSTATALDPSKKDADPTTRKAVTLTQDANGNTTTNNGYVLARQFLIRSSNPSMLAKGLTVKSIKVDSNKTGANGKPVFTMSTALRVGLAFTNLPGTPTSKTMIVAPVTVTTDTQGDQANKPTTSYKFYKDASDTAGEDVILTTIGETGAEVVSSSVTIPNGTSEAIKVIVYVWIEGEDNNLYSDNFHVEDLSVTVEFESKDFTGTAASGGGTQQPAETKVDLSSGTTINQTSTTAKASAGATSQTNYYAITGKTSIDGKQLYTDEASKGGLTASSKIYTISGEGENAVASSYTNVTLPS